VRPGSCPAARNNPRFAKKREGLKRNNRSHSRIGPSRVLPGPDSDHGRSAAIVVTQSRREILSGEPARAAGARAKLGASRAQAPGGPTQAMSCPGVHR